MRASDRIAHRVALRHVAGDEAVRLLTQADLHLERYGAWASGFADTLDAAKDTSAEDLGGHFVWQDELIELWQPFTAIQQDLLSILDRLQTEDATTAAAAEPYLDPPAQAQIEFATEDPLFLDRTGFDRKQIAYDTRRLRMWHENFMGWLTEARRSISALSSKI